MRPLVRVGPGRTGLLIVAWLLLPGATDTARARPPARQLSLQQAMDLALEQNPDLLALRAKAREARAAAKGALTSLLPTISLLGVTQVQTEYELDTMPDELKETITGLFPNIDPDSLKMTVAERWNALLGVTLLQPLTSLYPLYKLYRIRRLDEAAAADELAQLKLQVRLRVIRAYLRVYLAQAYRDIARMAHKLALAHLERVRRALALEAARKAELLQVQVKVSEVEKLVIQTDAGVKLAKSLLRFELGLPEDVPIRLTERFPDPPRIRSIRLDSCIRAALAHRPELALIRRRLEQARLGKQAAWFQYVPVVALFGGYQYSHGMSTMFPTNRWFVGALATWSFQWGKKKFKVDEIEAQQVRAKHLYRKAKAGIRLQVTKLYWDLRVAAKSLEVTRRAVEQAKERLRMEVARYENEAGTTTDVLGAQTALKKAQADHAASLYGYYEALAALKAAVGGKLP